MSKLPIKHRDSGRTVPFRPNPCQRIFAGQVAEQYASSGMIRAVVLKSRRVGISSWTDGLLLLHCCEREQAHAKIVAHLADTAEGLFRVPRDMAKGMPIKIGDIRTRDIHVFHKGGNSILDIATAGSVAGGRGLTLSALHLSEAASFPGEDSFTALLPAVSEGPDTIVVIESTAFGRVGPGRVFYDFWKSTVAGRNGYIPVFIGWLDDPTCTGDPADADDAPATDLERELMSKPFHATKAQIAWMRHTFENQCRGLEPKWLQEYPHSPDVAFVSTGDPAFTHEEMVHVRSTVTKPKDRGHLEWSGETPSLVHNRSGQLMIWEEPNHAHHYYIGADAAVGIESGDFASYCVIDGTTGVEVARYADRVTPEIFAEYLNLAGRWYNKGMLNVELTGNSGREVVRVLRDQLRYPNFCQWKGKDDKLSVHRVSPLIGWEMTTFSRRKLFDTFRVCIRGNMRGEDFPALEIRDEVCLVQMEDATLSESGRWEVEFEHDDILVATMLAAIAYVQNPPTRITGKRVFQDSLVVGTEDEQLRSALPKFQDDVQLSLQRHYRKVIAASRKPRISKINRLEGI